MLHSFQKCILPLKLFKRVYDFFTMYSKKSLKHALKNIHHVFKKLLMCIQNVQNMHLIIPSISKYKPF